MMNIFLYGLSGSGKDTVANFLQKEFDFLKIRIAGTIKQYVFETYGFSTQEEFEKLKRKIPAIRKEHNIFGEQYDVAGKNNSKQEATLNRIDAIINKELLEFEIVKDSKSKPICVVDVRTMDEAHRLLSAGYVGIFLTRISEEYKNTKHKTEQDIYLNNILYSYIFDNPKQAHNIYIALNSDCVTRNDMIYKVFDDMRGKLLFPTFNVEDLFEEVKKLVEFKIQEADDK